MFPHIECEQRNLSFYQWRILIGCAINFQFTFIYNQPRPSGTKSVQTGTSKLFLKLIKRSKCTSNSISNLARRLSACFWSHNSPKEIMIDESAAMVPNNRSDVLRN